MDIGIFGLWGMNIPGVSFGGFETGYTEVAERLVAAGHTVTIYCRRPEYPPSSRPSSVNGVNLVYVRCSRGKSLAFPTSVTTSLIASLLRRRRHDVHLFANVGSGLHCLLAKLLGCRVVLNVDGLDWVRGKWGFLARTYFKLAARAGMFSSDVVLTDADAMVDYYREHFAYTPEMIAYGAYVESSAEPDLVRQFGLEPGGYYLVASRLIPENNADVIVDAFKRVATERKLVIAGGSNYTSPFHQSLLHCGDPRVVFTGWIDDGRVVKELHCNAYAYLHGHSVGGTNPALLKALGYGNCVLALDTPFNSEVLDGGKYGLLWKRDAEDLARLIKSIEDEPAIAQELRRRAPERILAAYTWDKIGRQYVALLSRVAAGHSVSRRRVQAVQAVLIGGLSLLGLMTVLRARGD